MSEPRAEYELRLAARRAMAAAADDRSRQVANLRALTFLAFVAALILGSVVWTLAAVLVFVALMIVHELVERRKARCLLAVEHYQRALRRLDDAWHSDGIQHRDHVAPEHPYAADLDLFGPASLFARLCTARTRGGEATLAGWLLHPAARPEVLARQAAVLAMKERIELREDLALLGGDIRVATEPTALTAWGAAPPRIAPARLAPLRLLAGLFALAAVLAAIAGFVTDAGLIPIVVVAMIEAVVMRRLRPTTAAITTAVAGPRRDLDVIARLLARLEREPGGGSERLEALSQRLRGGATAIAELARTVDWLEARRSNIFAPIAFVLMWELHGAVAVERWRQAHGPAIAGWLAALAELEALAALAAYAYERPADLMPTIVDGGPCVRGDDLRHPLLRDCVANSLDLGGPLRMLMISGSNMSGKSTFLRTVGVNIVLALAGAPVSARALTLSPLQLGATLRIEDSLRGASSRFYSELRRLRLLRDLARAGDPPLFFLLDEIFHGTNSHDRKIGAEAVLRALVDAGAIGLCTTHDLALAEAITDLGERACNVHFQDEVGGDALVFDYQMRPGIVRSSNAIALMRSIGLLDDPQ